MPTSWKRICKSDNLCRHFPRRIQRSTILFVVVVVAIDASAANILHIAKGFTCLSGFICNAFLGNYLCNGEKSSGKCYKILKYFAILHWVSSKWLFKDDWEEIEKEKESEKDVNTKIQNKLQNAVRMCFVSIPNDATIFSLNIKINLISEKKKKKNLWAPSDKMIKRNKFTESHLVKSMRLSIRHSTETKTNKMLIMFTEKSENVLFFIHFAKWIPVNRCEGSS